MQFSSLMERLSEYVPGKSIENICKKTGLKPEQIVKLASNENPLGPPKEVENYLKKELGAINIYPDRIGIGLLEKLSEKFGLDKDNIFIGNGSSEIVDLLCRIILEPNDKAVGFKYEFALYKTCVLANRGIFEEAKTGKNFERDLESLEKKAENSKIVFIANPNNPTGDFIPREKLKNFIENLPENILIVLDEAYIEYPGEEYSLVNYLKKTNKKNLVILRTFSKIYGLAGLRVGYCFAHKKVIENLRKIKLPVNVPYLSQKGCEKALDCGDFVNKSRQLVKREKERLQSVFMEKGIQLLKGEGNFYLIKDKNAETTVRKLESKGIVVRSLKPYGITDYFRVTVGKEEENNAFVENLLALK